MCLMAAGFATLSLAEETTNISPADPELLIFLGGWEAGDSESYTPLEWLDMLDDLESTESLPSQLHTGADTQPKRDLE